MHGQRRDRHGGDCGQDAFPERMVGRALEEERCADADDQRQGDAPVNRRDEFAPAALPEVREADGDDQKRFEAFTQGDDERLEHGARQLRL